MSVTVSIPTPLRSFTGGRDAVDVVRRHRRRGARRAARRAHAGLKRHLVQDDGRLRTFVNLYLNDTDIRQLASTATPVRRGRRAHDRARASRVAAPRPRPRFPSSRHAEVLRYSRHLLLPEVGVEGQRKLKAARVLTIGAGGLGSPLSLYLAAAGVGTIGIVDFDVVDLTNLQRQIVHGTSTLGHSKLESAKARLTDLNPNVNVVGHEGRLTSENALDIIRDYDIVVDGTDNFPTRYLVNDACVLLGQAERLRQHLPLRGPGLGVLRQGRPLLSLPLLRAAASGTGARAAPRAACSACCPGSSAASRRSRRSSWIIGAGDSLIGRLVLFDALKLRVPRAQAAEGPELPDLRRASDDPRADRLRGLLRHRRRAGLRRRRDRRRGVPATSVRQKGDELVLIDVREPHEWEIAHIEGARLIPLSQLPDRLGELDGHAEIVTHCHHGARSMKALEILRGAGLRQGAEPGRRDRRLGGADRAGDGEVLGREGGTGGSGGTIASGKQSTPRVSIGHRRVASLARSRRTALPPYRLVPKAGLEPARACAHCALNAARLPVPPLRRRRKASAAVPSNRRVNPAPLTPRSGGLSFA